jgi:hypothetical protein
VKVQEEDADMVDIDEEEVGEYVTVIIFKNPESTS